MNCQYCDKECKNDNSLRNHQRLCKQNPNYQISWLELNQDKIPKESRKNGAIKAKELGIEFIVSEETRSKISKASKQQKPSDEKKRKTSESMKKAHAEGRAWNIGKSRWNNEPSYPEKFMMKVIENEFDDKNYVREFPVSIYSLDFAWVEKKKVIEIDGEQHERFQEYKDRDERKDSLLKECGWQVLRIKWKDLYHDTKVWIETAKNFIE